MIIFECMKFLKVFLNSLIIGFFFSLLLSLLIFNLNINLDLSLSLFIQLTIPIFITYGLLISFTCLIVFFFIQFFSGRNIKIAVISPSFLAFGFSFVLVLFLVIFRTNYIYFFSVFDLETKSLLKTQVLILGFLALFGPTMFYFFRYYKKNIFFFWSYFLIFVSAMFFTFYLRLSFPIQPEPVKIANLEAKNIDKKITIIGLEGLSFDFIIPLSNEGKLKNFSWLIEEGSWGKLESLLPNEPLTLNHSFNTGKFPAKHRQISLSKYNLLKIKTDIEIIPHYILFRQLAKIGLLKMSRNRVVSKVKDIWKIFEENEANYLKKDWPYGLVAAKPNQKADKLFNQFFQDLQYDTTPISRIVRESFFRDCEFEDEVIEEKTQNQPQLTYFLLNGLNAVEIYFYKYSFPDLFGKIDQEDLNRYSSIIEKYYQFYDQIIGKYLASLKEDELLIVYSSHGIEPLPLWKRFAERILGNPDVSAYHELAPEGVIFLYGKGVIRGKNIEGIRLIDIAPTLLYYLGFYVGKDMDGIAQTSVFLREFREENPVAYISSYDEVSIRSSEEKAPPLPK